MGKIILDGMEFFAYHGCFKEEQLIGTKFIVDLEIEADTSAAEKSDHLADTLNYVGIYQLVKTEMESKSHLLEHVANRIVHAIMLHFPVISRTDITIFKINPQVGGKMAKIGFHTFLDKNNN